MILSTDMAKHATDLAELKNLIKTYDINEGDMSQLFRLCKEDEDESEDE